jgi:hypothetical protein
LLIWSVLREMTLPNRRSPLMMIWADDSWQIIPVNFQRHRGRSMGLYVDVEKNGQDPSFSEWFNITKNGSCSGWLETR